MKQRLVKQRLVKQRLVKQRLVKQRLVKQRLVKQRLVKCLTARFEFIPQDAWVGAFWKAENVTWSDFDSLGLRSYRPAVLWNLWVCLLPCLPLHLEWFTFPRHRRRSRR